jgi:3-hydroxyacyl-CoA dehydrogenase
MGSGIAAHLSNLGFDVSLFDLTPESVRSAFDRAVHARPPHFYDTDAASRVKLFSIANDLERIRDSEWVCEAVVEKSDVKRELYERIEPLLADDAMISTNTSGLEISLLAEGRSDSFRERFLGTHFFNPPRYLKLIELIPTATTSSTAVDSYREFLENSAGRRVVVAKDTPGFIANRYGMWVLFHAIHAAEKLRLTVEQVDLITGPFLGRPKTATFRLADLIGIDIMDDIARNIRERCLNDARHSSLDMSLTLSTLLGSGRLGNKAGRGYYERTGKGFLVLNFEDGTYREAEQTTLSTISELERASFGERIRAALEKKDEVGEFLRLHLPAVLDYAMEIGSEISHSVEDFDRVMKWGFGWEIGPFEMVDRIGYDVLAGHLTSTRWREKLPFYSSGKHLDFATLRHKPSKDNARFATVDTLRRTAEGEGWRTRDDGTDGIVFEFDTKMNSLSYPLLVALRETIENAGQKRVTLANMGKAFSAGFDLRTFLKAAEDNAFEEVEKWLKELQRCGDTLRTARTAASVQATALGGGLELAMHCGLVLAAPEAVLGLPETTVGLIPAGGGTTILRHRAQADARAFAAAAMTIALGTRSAAAGAKKLKLLRAEDRIATNPDQILVETLESDIPEWPDPAWLAPPGPARGMIEDEIAKLRSAGTLAEYGAQLAEEVKHVFIRAKSYEHSLELERETFLRVLGRPQTILRIRHFLDTGKALHN